MKTVPAPTTASNYRPRLLLLVEDDPGMAELFRCELQQPGVQFEWLSTGQQARERLALRPDCLLLLDYSLPDMSAQALLEGLPPRYAPPFIVITGHGDERVAVNMMKLGARDYLIKDASLLDRLPAVVERVLRELENERRRIASERRFQAIFEGSDDALMLLDADGCLDCNTRALTLFGYSEKQALLGRQPGTISPPTQPDGRDSRMGAQAWIASALQGQVCRFEWTFQCCDGRTFPAEVLLSPFELEGRTILQSAVRDITERKRAEAALRVAEEHWRLAAEAAQMGTWDRDLRSGSLSWSASEERLMGYEPGTFPGTFEAFVDLVHPDSRATLAEAQQRARTGDGRYEAELRFRLRDGRERWGLVQGQVLRDDHGQPVRLVGVEIDITERKRAEAARRENEQKYRLLAENTDDFVTLFDAGWHRLYNSPAYQRRTGWTPADLAAGDWRTRAHPDDIPVVEQARAANEAGQPAVFEHRIRCRDGAWIWVESRSKCLPDPAGGEPQFLLSARDITARKQAERAREALHELAQELGSDCTPLAAARHVFAAADQLWQWDAGSLAVLRPGGELMETVVDLDVFAGERRELPPTDSVPKAPTPRLRRIMAHGAELMLRTPAELQVSDSQTFGDHHRLSASLMTVPIRQHGQVVGMLSVQSYTHNAFTQDDLQTLQSLADHCGGALERIRAQQALRESEERYRSILTASPDAVIIMDTAARILMVSPGMLNMFGYERTEQVIGRLTMESVVPEDRARALANLSLTLQGSRFGPQEYRSLRADGSSFDIEVNAEIARDAGGQPFQVVLIIRDISERKRVQERLARSETRFRSLIENAPDGIVLVSAQGVMTFASPAARRMFGFGMDEPITVDPNTSTHPEDLPRVLAALADLLRQPGETTTLQYRFKHADGTWRWIESTFTNLVGLPGVEALVINFRDITEARRLEAALKQRLVALTQPLDRPEGITLEELFDLSALQRLQDEFATATGVASLITRPDGTPITRPTNFCRLCADLIRCTEAGRRNCCRSDVALGRFHPEGPVVQPCLSGGLWDAGASISVGGYHVANWLVGQVRDETQTDEQMRSYARSIGADEADIIAAFHEVPAMAEARFRQVAQALFTMANQLSATAYQNVQQARFITERQAAETALHRQQEFERALLDNLSSGVIACDGQGKLVLFNRVARNWHGQDALALPPEEWGRHYNLFGPDGVTPLPTDAIPLLRAFRGEHVRDEEMTIVAAGQPPRLILASASPFYDAQHNRLGAVVVLRDITEPKRTEAALRQSEHELRVLTDNVPAMFSYVGADRCYRYVNRRYEEWLGLPVAEITGKQVRHVLGETAYAQAAPHVEAALAGQRVQFEATIAHKTDSQRSVAVEYVPDSDAHGKVSGFFVLVTDITERKRSEIALRESEERFRGTLEGMLEGCQIVGFDWRYRYINAAAALNGRSTVAALLGRTMQEAYPGIEHTPLFARLQRCMEQRVTEQFTNEFVFPDGAQGWFELVVQPVAEGIFIRSGDITERRRAETALRESEARYRQLFEAESDAIFLVNLETGRFVDANESALRLYGYSREECLRLGVADISAEPERSREAVATGKRTVPLRWHRKKDGTPFPVEIAGSYFESGGHPMHVAAIRDITERYQAEAALRDSETRYRLLAENGTDVIWLLDLGSQRFTYVSPSVERLRGYTAAEVMQQTLAEVMTPESYQMVAAALPVRLAAFAAGDESVRTQTHEICQGRRDGSRLQTEVVTTLITDERGRVTHIQGVTRDITERKRAAVALRESEVHFRTLADSGQALVWTSGLDQQCNYFNQPWLDFTGRTLAQEQGSGWTEGVHPDDLERCVQTYRAAFERRERFSMDYRLRRFDGEYRWFQDNGTPRFNHQGEFVGYIGHCLDITERRAAEERSRLLRNLGLGMAGATNEAEALRLCLTTALGVAGMDGGGIYLMDERTGHLELAHHTGLSDEFVAAVARFTPESPNARWARQGMVFHGCVAKLDLPTSAAERQEGLRALSSLPVHREGELIALLNVASHSADEIQPAARHSLESVAGVMAGLLQRLRAQAALRQAHAELEQRVIERTAQLEQEVADRRLAEAVLRESEQFNVAVLNSLPAQIAVVDREGTVLGVNARWHQFAGENGAGNDPQVQVGANYLEVCRQASRQGDGLAQAALEGIQAVLSGVRGEFQLEYPCASPSLDRWFLLQVTPVASGLGEAILSHLDITARRQADAQLRKLRSAVEQSPTVVVITDREGTIEYVNPSFTEQTGYTAAEAVGQNPRVLKSGAHPPEFYIELWQTLRAGRVWRGELCNRRKDGTLYWEATAIAPIRDDQGHLTHFVAIKEDITDRRRVAEELRQAKESADAANASKSRFLANMSHEIRTPMNAILGFAQLMDRDPTLTPQQRQRLSTINSSGEHLLRLISDILDLSKIEAGRAQLTLADCDFRALLKDAQSLFALRAEEKRLRFEVQVAADVPERLHADAGKVRQVLLNLLANAVKFTARGRICLRVTAEPAPAAAGRPVATRLCLEVADTGVGIAPPELERVFDPFQQTESSQQQGGGTGLGLAISRQLARLMSGDLTVTSEVDAGSTFRFTFLAAVAESAGPGPALAAPRRVLGLKPVGPPPIVLVVDDIESNRSLLRDLLEGVGFVVREAADGASAIARCAVECPALVLVDRRMPGLDGLAAIRAIRAGPAGAAPRILMISANVLSTPEEDWQLAGADGFISKPIKEETLLAQIGTLLGLDYFYESVAPAAVARPAMSWEAIAQVPADLRAAILRATEAGDVLRLRELIAGEVQPRFPRVAEALRELAANYDYEAILHALRKPEPHD
jgi:PAS domain S-box-containing protein